MITRKETIVPEKPKAKSKSNTPTLTVAELMPERETEMVKLHSVIRQAKSAADALKASQAKVDLIQAAKQKMFTSGLGSFYLDLGDGMKLLLKPSTRRYPLTDAVATQVEKVMEDAGYDAGDYYHESHQIKIDADKINTRLSEDNYMEFQADMAELMAKYKLGDCWAMETQIMPNSDFFEARNALPLEVNEGLEKCKPSTISVEAKQEL